MNQKFIHTLIVTLLLSLQLPATASAPSIEAKALIEELGLTQSDTPIAKQPDWKPERVIIMGGKPSPEYEQKLKAAAGDVELVFGQPAKDKSFDDFLAGADAVIGYCTSALLKNADSRLRWVHNYTVGMDNCTGLSDIQLEKVTFTNNKRLSGPAIAEHTIAMLLAISHNLPGYQQAQQEGKWHRAESSNVTFGELKGKTLLVVGLGGIGTEIAWRAHGLGMRVIATRNSSKTGPDYVEYVGLSDELNTLAGRADVVVNALPLTPETTDIFNKAFFEAIKPGAIFLSVGRGKSTVTSDLIAALQSGKLFGAGLDVTDPEPLPKDSPLWYLPNVIITPHVSTAGGSSGERSQIIVVENLRRYVAGEPMLNVVDMKRGY